MDVITNGTEYVFPSLSVKDSFLPMFDKQQYREMVRKTIHYIHEGDIFQAVISNPLSASAEGSLFDVYRVVTNFHEIVRFSHVMHISSTVTGTLAKSKDGLDAVEAILPAGTLSGAPKIRAVEIIDELEGKPRGVYGGTIGYIDLSGNLDMSIAIRFAYLMNGKVTVHTGSGIVAESNPDTEATECLNKAKAVLKAIEMAKGGLFDSACR